MQNKTEIERYYL